MQKRSLQERPKAHGPLRVEDPYETYSSEDDYGNVDEEDDYEDEEPREDEEMDDQVSKKQKPK